MYDKSLKTRILVQKLNVKELRRNVPRVKFNNMTHLIKELKIKILIKNFQFNDLVHHFCMNP